MCLVKIPAYFLSKIKEEMIPKRIIVKINDGSILTKRLQIYSKIFLEDNIS